MPIGLNFGNNPGDIAVNGSNLQVNNGETLALLGGNLTVTRGQIVTPGGRIELGSVGENSFVSLTSTNPGWLLDHQDINNFQNLRLLDNTNVAVNGNGKGSIAINANNIELHSGSSLQAGIDADFQLLETQAKDITLNASGKVSIDNGTIINEVQEQAIGNGGNINITGRSLFLDNGAKLSANSLGEGNTGSIILNARDTFSYDGVGDSNATFISASLFGTGNGSQITINAPKVSLLNGATVVSHNIGGRGNAGSIEINVTDNILIDGVDSGVGSQVFDDGIGNGGTITVDAPRVSVLNGAAIVAHTHAQGNAGDIRINANEVLLDGVGSNNGFSSGIGSAAFELATGTGGTIAIYTDSLDVTNGAALFVSSFGAEDAGTVIINATGAVSFDGTGSNGISSNAFSTVEAESSGNAREIEIKADSLSVADGAIIGASTSGQGNGGDVSIEVNTLQLQNGGQIVTTSRGSGDAGNISINTAENTIISGIDENFAQRLARTGRPLVRNEGAASGIFVNTDVDSTGSGGDIRLVTGDLFLSEGAVINATNQGNSVVGKTGGNVDLQIANNLTLRDNSTISAQALENADGGNIDIDAEFVIAFPNQNSDIIASAAQGTGGNIDITTNSIFGLEARSSTPINNTNDLDASSEFGLDGTLEINELEVNPAEGLEELPVEIIDVTRLVDQNLCQQAKDSEFIVTGKGGIAPSPTQPRDGEISEVNLVEPATFEEDNEVVGAQALRPAKEEIVEAQGWIINDRGKVELVAHKTAPNSSPPQPKDANICNASIKY